jgi:sugar phosphate isomerase/epimerase
MRFAYNTLVYGDEPIEQGIARLARFGYDGVELVGAPDRLDAGHIVETLDKHEIRASSICGLYGPETDLVSSDPAIRRAALAYVRSCVDFAAAVGAEVISVTPTACMKIRPEADREVELGWAEEGLRAAGEYAGEHGVRLAVEPWNRYENYLVNRVEQSASLVDRVGLPSVGCMVDTFHMAIEERSATDAIRLAGDRLYHVHFADSNRAAPGRGHIDFIPILETLEQIGYGGYISFELLPAAGDPFLLLGGDGAKEFLDQYTREAIEYIKHLAGTTASA